MSSWRTLMRSACGTLLVLLLYTSAYSEALLTIDHPSDTAFLSYQLQTVTSVDYGMERKPVRNMLRVIEPRRTPSDSIIAIQVENSPLNQDEAASVFVKYLPSGAAITQDPVFLTITDYEIFKNRTTGRYGVACGGYRGDSAFIARNFPGDNSFDFLYIASGVDHTGNGQWEPSLQHLLTEDYDYDGTREMFFYLACGRDKRPRALVCIDIEKLAIEWYLPMASSPNPGGVVSCRDSLHPGVLVCTYGPENGETDANFDDRFGFFCRVDSHGQVMYNYRLSPKFRGPKILARPFDSLYVLFHPWAFPGQTQDTTVSYLSLVTAGGTVVRTITVSADLLSMGYHQCDADSALDLLTVDGSGRVCVFTSDLKLKAASEPSDLGPLITEVTLSGQTEPSYVFSSRLGLAIYSRQFECLAAFPFDAGDFLPTAYGPTGFATAFVLNSGNGYHLGRIVPRTRTQAITSMLWRFHNWFLAVLAIVSLLLVVMTYRRRSTLQALELMEERNRAILNASPDLMLRVSRNGVFLDYQSGTDKSDIFIPEGQFLNRHVGEVMPPWFAEKALPLIEQVLKTGQMQVFEYQLPVGGAVQDYEARMVMSGKDEVLAVIRNITERKTNQAAVERQARILQQVDNAIILTDTSGVVLEWNQGAERISGYSAEEVVGKHISLAISAEDWPVIEQTVIAALQNDSSFQGEIKVKTKRGADLYLQWSASVMHDSSGRPVSWVGYGADITDRKLSELALRESEEKYRALAEHSSQGILLLYDSRIIFVNRRFAEILETTVDTLASLSAYELLAATAMTSEIDKWTERLHMRLAGKRPSGREEIDVRTFQGKKRRIEVAVTRIDLSGKPIVQITWIDITARYEAEQALRISESKFRAVTESMSAAITIFDKERLLYCNPASVRITGYTLEELLQMYFWEILHPDYRDLVQQRGISRLMGGNVPNRYEVKILTKSGEERWVDYAAQVVEFGGGPAVLGTAIDITERKAAEDALQRLYQERYEQVKEIAGGVSHEIYNALFPATTTLFTLRNRLEKGALTPDDLPRNLKLIDLADQAVARAIHMTETVTRFSRLESDRRLDCVRIGEVVGDILQQLRLRIDAEQITATVSIPQDLAVVCNRSHLYSLFTNLVMNALDALAEVPQRQLNITARAQNAQAIVQVSDTGPGIPPENLPKIFNAFFSTKPSSGTGLGLAVVQKIVDMYGGRITVESCLDRGTTFTILLPQTTQQWGEATTGTHEGKDPDRR